MSRQSKRAPGARPRAASRLRRRVLAALALAAPLVLFFASRVDETLTDRDKTAIETLGVTTVCRQAKGNFEAEIACFRHLQQRLAEHDVRHLARYKRWERRRFMDIFLPRLSHSTTEVLSRKGRVA